MRASHNDVNIYQKLFHNRLIGNFNLYSLENNCFIGSTPKHRHINDKQIIKVSRNRWSGHESCRPLWIEHIFLAINKLLNRWIFHPKTLVYLATAIKALCAWRREIWSNIILIFFFFQNDRHFTFRHVSSNWKIVLVDSWTPKTLV